MGVQMGNLEWVHLLGTFERWLKGAPEVELLSLSLSLSLSLCMAAL
jgi:hypothetical protein